MTSTVIPLRQSAVGASLKHAAFDHLGVPVVCLNAAAQVLALNPPATALFEAPVESFVGRHLSEVLSFGGPYRAARRWARLWSRLMQHGRVSVPAVLPLIAGRRLIVRVEAELMHSGQDAVAVVVLREAAAERVAARRARERESQQRVLTALRGNMSGLIGADQRVISVSANVREVAGISAEELRGLPVDYLLDEATAAEFAQAFARVLVADRTQVHCLRWRLRQRPGVDERWFECRLRNHLSDPWVRAVAFEAEDLSGSDAVQRKIEALERRLRTLASYSTDLLMVVDGDLVVRYQAPVARSTLDVVPESTLGVVVTDLVLPEDRPALRETIEALVRDGVHTRTCVARVLRRDGVVRRMWFTARDCGGDAAVGGVMVAGVDITELTEAAGNAPAQMPAPIAAQRKLAYRERLLDLAIQTRMDWTQSLSRVLRAAADTLECALVGYWRRAVDGTEMRCESMYDRAADGYAQDWFGRQIVLNDYPRLAVALADRKAVPFGEADLIAGHAPSWPDTRALIIAPVLLDGEVLGLLTLHDALARTWADEDAEFATTSALVLSLAVEGAQRQEAESRIEQLAWYDSLTGLPNRNLLRESMRDMIMTAANRRRRIAVMLTDLDRFKDVNDTLGHLVGDTLIKSAAQVLHDTVGDAGMVARLGGDEFVVLINEFEHRQEVAVLAARIAHALNRTDLIPNVDTQVSASIGVALFPEHGRDMSTLLKNADSAMYQAKRDGRNQFSFFNPVRYERAAREVQLGIQLHKAVQSGAGQFFVEYQPQVEIASGRVVGLEALIRWQHRMYGRLTPDSFIGVAEMSGLSERISRWVVNEVCAQIVRWRVAVPGFDIPVAINVAGRELGSSTLPLLVRGALLKHGIEPSMIVLEITERTLVHDSEINNDVMNELASLGVGIVLDDFGTGYSMLGYLKRMPIQALKIDQSFVKGIPEDADSNAIVHAMLAVARHFKLKVIAEGIESAAQVDYLSSIGCNYAQGYYFSRALEPQAVLESVGYGGVLNATIMSAPS